MSHDNQEATIAGAVGTALGAAGSLSTVAVSGSVFGLGATGITSGLATIGGVVGGGMASGLVVAVAAPVAVGAVTYGLYRWFKD